MTDGITGRDTLLDAGPLIAMLVRRDAAHERIRAEWPAYADRCLTTEPILVEAAHVAQKYGGNPADVLEFVIAAGIPVFALHLPMREQCVHLLRRYADTPMDYADATLVALADRLHLSKVFTLDRRGFRTYRGARGLPFEVV